MRTTIVLAASLASSGCTLASGVNDFAVDDGPRDLSYEFVGMLAHSGVPLDVAVVDGSNVLQARARIVLPLFMSGVDYPDVKLVMKDALTSADHSLYFFADNDGDLVLDGSASRIEEHCWIEEVDPDGVGKFVHSTNFQFFTEDAYTSLNGDLVLKMPNAAAGVDLLACLRDRLGEQAEVRLTLVAEERQVGLFRRYRDTQVPSSIRLAGILDGGNQYRIEVLVDGKVQRTLEKSAPPDGDLVIEASEWFPVSLADIAACR